MKKELQKLFDEHNRIKEHIKSVLRTEAESLVKLLAKGKITEEELRGKLSDLIRSSDDIIPVYRFLVDEAKKQGIALNSINKGLAKRLVEKAKKEFMPLEMSELNEAGQLFEQLGMKEEAKKCKEMAETMFAIAEDNEEKLEIL